jgi:hypothetical protein
MDRIKMSERELKRVEVLSEVKSGRRSRAAAASLLGVSERQLYWLMARNRADGGFGVGSQVQERTSNRSINFGIRQYVFELAKSYYADFGPTLATEALEQRHGIHVGRETLRGGF